ncbi:MAG: ABC transporter permease subunit [bacterium]
MISTNQLRKIWLKEKNEQTKSFFSLNLSISEIVIYFIALSNMLFFALVIGSLFVRVNIQDIIELLHSGVFKTFVITFGSLFISVIITLVIGFPTAYAIVREKNFLYKIIDIISIVPIIIPPSVTGLALLMTFGRRGILGHFFYPMGINLAFNFISLIIVQIFIMMPIFILIVKNGLKSFDRSICESAMLEGAGEKELLFRIYLPLSARFILTAVILCSLRAIGEFGATIMFAGNIHGKTQTITTTIYSLYQTNITEAISLAVIVILLFLILLAILNLVHIINNN